MIEGIEAIEANKMLVVIEATLALNTIKQLKL